MKQERKAFVSAGHCNVIGKDRGASTDEWIEGDLAVEFRDLIAMHLRDMCVDVVVDDNRNITSETIRFFKNKVSASSIVVDIHWNAATPAATGVEVLVPDEASTIELKLAYKVADTISKTLGIKKRGNFKGYQGVKSELSSHHGRLGWMRLTGENILIETCFLTNPDDMASYQKHKLNLAYLIALDIFDAICLDYTENHQVHHTVQRGDTLSTLAVKYNTTTDKLQKLNFIKDASMIRVGQVLKTR